jgi:aspartyl-tRNA(Asn)/glutamyl-tRNA(Gln) amidotransferase subunit A
LAAPLSIESTKTLLEQKRSTASHIVSRCLETISRLNKRFGAYISVFAEEARHKAQELDREAERRASVPALFAAPLAIKDNIWVKGHPTTAAIRLFENFIPRDDAQLVVRLRRSDTIILGKNNMHALALGATSTSSLYGPVRNPFDPRRVAGGSSGGTAVAVALSMAAGGIGTDTGGSVRIPATFCGLVGFKPTWSRIGLHGVIPLSPTLDHVGVMAHTVPDALILFHALTKQRSADPQTLLQTALQTLSQRAVKIGIPENYCENLDPRVEKDFHHTVGRLEGLGFEVVNIALPAPSQVHRARSIIMLKEASMIYGEALKRSPEDFPPDVRALLRYGASVREAGYIDALSFRGEVVARLIRQFEGVHFIAMPTVWTVAPRLEDVMGKEHGAVRRALLTNTGLFNLTGMPAITVPMAVKHGLFTGLQIAAQPMADDTLLAIAHQLEAALRVRPR